MSKTNKYSPEVRERAVRLVQEARKGSAIAMGSRRVDSADDWMFNGHVARVGQETRSRYWRT
jgi:hypothetical protein